MMQNNGLKNYLFLLELVREEDIDTLEYLYRGVQERYEQEQENTPGDLEKYLRYYPIKLKSAWQLAAQWQARYPQSYAAHIILADCILSDAYTKRGTLPVASASVYSLKSLKDGMDHAGELLETAVTLSRRPFHAWLYLGYMNAVDPRYGTAKEFTLDETGDLHQLPYWYKKALQLEPGSITLRIAMLDALRKTPPEIHQVNVKNGEPMYHRPPDVWSDSMQAYAYLLYSGLPADARNEVRAVYRGHYAFYCWLGKNAPSEALPHIETMYRLAPHRGAAALARFYACRKDWGKALLYFKEALSYHPENIVLLYDYAGCLSQADPASHQAVVYYRRAARYGHPAAMMRLGDIYRKGLNAQSIHLLKALNYYQMALQEGYTSAGEQLAQLYWRGEDGNTGIINRVKAIHILENIVQQGNGWACARLAELELEKRSRTHDYSAATHYVNLGMHYGSIHCYYLVGKRIYEGRLLWRGVHVVPGYFFKPNKDDRKMALEYLMKSASLGYLKAMACLARYFDKGYEEDRDPYAAAEWYCKAADQDLQDEEGCCFPAFKAVFYGDHKARNLKSAARYLHQGATVAGSECQNRLAFELLKGTFAYDSKGLLQPQLGVANDYNIRIALGLYERSAAVGHVESMYYLAEFYERNAVSKADHLKAFRYFLQAAEAGKTVAQKEVGCYYLNGLAVEKNETYAMFWLSMAADSGEVTARELLDKVKIKN
ncbi:MAG TPA: tetratricopeptide repeat protein [Chitinophaga sp.]|uniref:tetratricopeptide repeat protein n=1 Tax=Chitinophaga sp. TaxID=1869181 RepID=UPI002F928402